MPLTPEQQQRLEELRAKKQGTSPAVSQGNLSDEQFSRLQELRAKQSQSAPVPDSLQQRLAELRAKKAAAKSGPQEPDYSPPTTWGESVTKPFWQMGEQFEYELKSGKDLAAEFFRDPNLKNAFFSTVGASQLFFSPLTAVVKPWIGKPVENTLKAGGVPEAGARIAGEAATVAAEIFLPGAVVKSLKGAVTPGARSFIDNYDAVAKQLIRSAEEDVSKKMIAKDIKDFISKKKTNGLGDLAKSIDNAKFKPGEFADDFKVAVVQAGSDIRPGTKMDDVIGTITEKIGAKYGDEVAGNVRAVIKNNNISPVFLERVYSKGIAKGARVGKDLPHRIKYKDLLDPGLNARVVDEIASGAYDALLRDYDGSQRIFTAIMEKLRLGEINPAVVPEVMDKYGWTPEVFAEKYAYTISNAGRILNTHSRLGKQFAKIFEDNPKAAATFKKIYDKHAANRTALDRMHEAFMDLEDFRRGMLVTQIATAMRNAESQGARMLLASADEAIQGALRGLIKGQGVSGKLKSAADEAADGFNMLAAFYNRLKPASRKQFDKIIDSEAAALSKARLMSNPVHEVVVGSGGGKVKQAMNKTAEVFNIFNRFQERQCQKIAYEAKMRQLLKREQRRQAQIIKSSKKRGRPKKQIDWDWRTVDPKDIPTGMHEKALDYALEMSFARNPSSQAGKEFLRSWKQLGLTTINPFPRFAFGNALPFVAEHSPAGFIWAFKPSTMRQLAKGNPEQFAKSISRASLGSLMFKSAWHIRQSEYAGEKWYQIKIGEEPDGTAKYVDVRPFAPFSAYFLMSEMMIRPENLKPADYIEAAVGLNRISGTGLVMVDMLRAKKFQNVKDLGKELLDSYAGSFTVVGRSAKDLAGEFMESERVYRNPRLGKFGIANQAINNLPFTGNLFPESVSPLTTKKGGMRHPAIRQATGFSIKEKNLIQREVDSLNIGYESIYPGTGIELADQKIAQYMAPMTEYYGAKLVSSPRYQKLPTPLKRKMVKTLLKATREQAKIQLTLKNPNLAFGVKIKQLPKDEREMLIERLGIDAHDLDALWED